MMNSRGNMRSAFVMCLLLLPGARTLCAQQVVRLSAQDQALRRNVSEVFTVGAAEGGGADVFGAVGDVGFDHADNLYVLNRLNARVSVFDSTGHFLRAMGRRGGGPGELSTPQQMAVTRAGEVIVSDVGRRALVIFARDGSARSVPFPGVTMLIGRRLALHPRGGVVSLAMGNPSGQGANTFGEELLLWLPTGGGAPRQLATVSTPASRATGTSGVRVHASPIFSPSFQFAVLHDGGTAVVDSAAYSIRILNSDGRAVRVLQRPIAPRRVTARDREHERARRAAQLSQGGGLRLVGGQGGPIPAPVRQSMANALEDAEFASVMPVIRRIGIDPAGTLWIERTGPSLDARGAVDLVDPAGRYLGTLSGWELPAVFSPRGRAAYVREDDQGVQRVAVVRIHVHTPPR